MFEYGHTVNLPILTANGRYFIFRQRAFVDLAPRVCIGAVGIERCSRRGEYPDSDNPTQAEHAPSPRVLRRRTCGTPVQPTFSKTGLDRLGLILPLLLTFDESGKTARMLRFQPTG